MDIKLKWNCEIADRNQRKEIEQNILNEIDDSYRRLGIESESAIVSISHDPFTDLLIGTAKSALDGDIDITFTYSLSSGHSASYKKIS